MHHTAFPDRASIVTHGSIQGRCTAHRLFARRTLADDLQKQVPYRTRRVAWLVVAVAILLVAAAIPLLAM